ncbi:Rieske (2Fe-2S) protein [Nonomuraea antri]|uniref:Rieske (2Fe-2S) protein n=1 Tax=Nonomuraea antri TaxID=2730852 RepID=UPI002E28A375|nr:Rieske (2Fe-2S) protein [Nonomuraea antri]
MGVGGLALAITACGGGTDTAQPSTGAPAAPESSAPAASSAPPAGGGGLAKTSEIPVGGGTVFKDQKIVVTQPAAGQFKAFSAVCTHQGCAVGSVSNGTINCPCHGSKFAIADGAVTDGPAKEPLPEKQIKVEGDQITLA